MMKEWFESEVIREFFGRIREWRKKTKNRDWVTPVTVLGWGRVEGPGNVNFQCACFQVRSFSQVGQSETSEPGFQGG